MIFDQRTVGSRDVDSKVQREGERWKKKVGEHTPSCAFPTPSTFKNVSLTNKTESPVLPSLQKQFTGSILDGVIGWSQSLYNGGIVPTFIFQGTVISNIGMNKKGKDREVTWRVIRHTINGTNTETQCIAVYFPPEKYLHRHKRDQRHSPCCNSPMWDLWWSPLYFNACHICHHAIATRHVIQQAERTKNWTMARRSTHHSGSPISSLKTTPACMNPSYNFPPQILNPPPLRQPLYPKRLRKTPSANCPHWAESSQQTAACLSEGPKAVCVSARAMLRMVPYCICHTQLAVHQEPDGKYKNSGVQQNDEAKQTVPLLPPRSPQWLSPCPASFDYSYSYHFIIRVVGCLCFMAFSDSFSPNCWWQNRKKKKKKNITSRSIWKNTHHEIIRPSQCSLCQSNLGLGLRLGTHQLRSHRGL